MKTINTEALRQKLETETPAVFDVRGDVDYELGHIPGSHTAPLGSLVFRVARIMDPDSFVAVYSRGAGCELASEAADRLGNLGLKNVHVYEEGLAGWEGAGLPVVESVHPKLQARGPVVECRSIVVDRATAYGGAFARAPSEMSGAGG